MEKKKRYTPVKEIGRGAFATVYLAKDNKLSRKVAIKVFHGKNIRNSLARFTREIEICRNLKHPNIVTIFDANVKESNPHIVMEFVDGEDLSLLIAGQSLPLKTAISIIREVALALKYLHSQNVIHRDLKPSNIMIAHSGKAVLMDFNLALCDEYTMLTEEGFTVGTPRFMAPEVLCGESASEKTDIYSLGLIFYEILSKGAVSKSQVTAQTLLARKFKPLQDIDPTIPDAVSNLVTWATNKDPKKRCPDATSFIEALDKASSTETPRKSVAPQKTTASLKTTATPKTSNRTETTAIPPIPSEPENSQNKKAHLQNTSPAIKLRPARIRKTRAIFLSVLIVFLIAFTGYISTNTSPQNTSPDQNRTTDAKSQPSHPTSSALSVKKEPISHLSVEKTQSLIIDHLNQLTGKQVQPAGETLNTVHSLFHNLVQKLRREPQRLKNHSWEIFILYGAIQVPAKNTTAGRNLCLSLSRVLKSLDTNFLPANSTILDCRNGNENETNQRILNLLNSADSSSGANSSAEPDSLPGNPDGTFDQRVTYNERLLMPFLLKIREEKNKLNIAPPRRDFLGFLAPNWKNQENVSSQLGEIIKRYARHVHLAVILMRISDSNSTPSLFIMEAVRDCLKYSWYGFHHIMVEHFQKMGEFNPSGREFTRKYSAFWKEAAVCKLHDGNYTQWGYTVCKFNDVLKDIASVKDQELKDSYALFAHKTQAVYPLPGVAMINLGYTTIGNQPSSPSLTESSYLNILSIEEETLISDFEGWAGLTCIISNQFFLQLKKSNDNEKRRVLSLKLLKKIHRLQNVSEDRNCIESVFIRAYTNSVCLKICTLIHCCDAYLETGKNFFVDEAAFAKQIQAEALLQRTSQNREQNDARGGGLASVILLKNQPLKQDELLLNPLRYN